MFLLMLVWMAAAETWSAPTISDSKAILYLSQYGYLNPQARNPNSGAMISEDTIRTAIAEFQVFAGINITGELDQETAHTMALPRCGVQDVVGYASESRTKRYSLQGTRWRRRNITYRVSTYPRQLAPNKVDAEIEKAFNVWSDVTPLIFMKKEKGQVHIEIRFEKGEHGDGDPFDGPGGTLAHAYYPAYGGNAHFDDSETWTVGSFKGTNLFQVAAHEFGHALGLSHSDVKKSLMAPIYRGYVPHFKLDEDDVQGIQALYGKSKDEVNSERTTTEPSESTEDDAELCSDASIDAMFYYLDKSIYIFKGKHYWRLTYDGHLASGYPKIISNKWPGLPGNIDSAFMYQNNKVYFFKGSQYWRYAGKTLDGDYPKQISEGFTGIPDNIDTAFVWNGNGKIYFFKGSEFWRFDPNQEPPVMKKYPKPLSNWEGLPNNIDAALSYVNGTYFFKKEQYYRFNDIAFAVDKADPPFPRPSAYWWFGCKAESSKSKPRISGKRHRDEGKNHQHSYVDDIIMDTGEVGSHDKTSGRLVEENAAYKIAARSSFVVAGIVILVSTP